MGIAFLTLVRTGTNPVRKLSSFFLVADFERYLKHYWRAQRQARYSEHGPHGRLDATADLVYPAAYGSAGCSGVAALAERSAASAECGSTAKLLRWSARYR